MIDLEHELRATLTGSSGAPIPAPDAAARVLAGVRRRRRRRRTIAGAAAAVTLFAGTVTVLGPGPQPQPADAGTVPWIDEWADPPVVSARRPARPDAVPCDPARLKPVQTMSRTDSGMANAGLANTGSDRCTLAGRPVLVGTDPGTGRRGPVEAAPAPDRPGRMTREGAGGSFPADIHRQYPATIDPGESAVLDVFSSCWTTSTYRDVSLRIGDREIPLPDLSIGATCTPEVGSWYVEPPVRRAPLTVAVQVPARAHRGQFVDYTVTLGNPSGSAVAFDGCAVYQAQLASNEPWRRLNCAVRGIPAGGSVRVAMRSYVPPDAEPGPDSLYWSAVLPNGEQAWAGDIRVEIVP